MVLIGGGWGKIPSHTPVATSDATLTIDGLLSIAIAIASVSF